MKEDGYPAADQYGGVLVIVLLITIIVKHRLHVTWFMILVTSDIVSMVCCRVGGDHQSWLRAKT